MKHGLHLVVTILSVSKVWFAFRTQIRRDGTVTIVMTEWKYDLMYFYKPLNAGDLLSNC
jgi:hypothetical protein